jgi:hypothetical protein
MKRKPDNSIDRQYTLSFDEAKIENSELQAEKTKFVETATEGGSLKNDEKYILRIIFKNKIHNADGQKFEDTFTEIMRYVDPEFQQIKPHGKAGDKKNDGYIKSKGIYFQVYGPEDIKKTITYAKKKLNDDLSGLIKEWKSINEFYFIINDKYKGIPPELEIETNNQITKNKLKGGVKGAAYLEYLLFSLTDDQILTIVGSIPDPSKIKLLNYSILNEVIEYMMTISLVETVSSDILVPDWDKKIAFNDLSSAVARLLNNGSMQIAILDEYLMNQGVFFADTLRNKINTIYISEKKHFTGDQLFWQVVNTASPKEEQTYQSAVIVIMAKYFEACDIFERPPEDFL